MSGELQSWAFPSSLEVGELPAIGQRAPQHEKLQIPEDGKSTILTFLRHCGCPCIVITPSFETAFDQSVVVAEKTFLSMRDVASTHSDIHFIAVSHSGGPSTNHWVREIGGAGNISVVIDPERESYAAWGLGVSSFWHVLNPWSLYSVYILGKKDGIWNRPTESGTRWQSSGSFGIDREGLVRWSKPSKSADEIPNFLEGIEATGGMADKPISSKL